jgi:invasion protein IalB
MYKQLSKGLMALTLMTGTLTMGPSDMAQAQTSEGLTSLTETYRDWIVRCVPPQAAEGQAAPGRFCEMTQELRHQESGQRVLAAALQPGETGASLTLVAPFGLLLSKGIKIAVDGAATAEAEFRTCLPGGCVSVIGMDQVSLDKFMAGEAATVTMRDTSDQEITLNISLAGFTSAWNRLKDL